MAAGRRRPNIDSFLSGISNAIRAVDRTFQSRETSVESVRRSIGSVDQCLTQVARVQGMMIQEEHDALLTKLRKYRADLHREEVKLHQSPRSSNAYKVSKRYDGRKGKPKFDIPREQLQFLMALNFNVVTMAELLCVSESSITRRMREFGLSMQGRFTNISDEELDALVQAATENNCNLGYRSVIAHLRSRGTIVQEVRVREAMRRVDAVGVALRWGNSVQRRSYRVPVPNSLWHIDGNHKLIRWKMVVHGCVDGYSRLITFMKVADNNRASTVLSAFTSATQSLGVPSRVRMDCGVENVDVETFMLQQRGHGRGSLIKGRSVHNQRIERLWLDVFQGVLSVFYNIFSTMEELHILDVGIDAQLWALHFVFLPRVQRNLDTFIQQWNSHGLTTEHDNTPYQLFTRGILASHGSDYTEVQSFMYGEDGAEGEERDVDLPRQLSMIQCSLTPDEVTELQGHVNPLDGDSFGIDTYKNVLLFLTEKL